MGQSFFQTLRDGKVYSEKWPRHSVVAAMTESRIIPMTRKGVSWVPAIAVFNAALTWHFLPSEQFATGIMLSLIMLSLPLQGIYWLGWRSQQKLKPQLKHWYFELTQKLKAQGVPVNSSHHKGPRYMDLALVLRQALDQLPPHEH